MLRGTGGSCWSTGTTRGHGVLTVLELNGWNKDSTFDGSTPEVDDSILLKVPGQTDLNDGQRRKRAGPEINRPLVIFSR